MTSRTRTAALLAVSASSNRSKGDQDPAQWKPARTEVRHAAPGAVSFGAMECDAPGTPDDATNANEEWVDVVNGASVPVDFTGWTVSDLASNT